MPDQTSRELSDLLSLYHAYERTIHVIPAPDDSSLKNLVTFDNSKDAPVHRWYTFKEGYSNKLLGTLEELEIIPKKFAVSLLDPFCGVATTILSCQIPGENGHVRRAVGVERNPAIYAIARAKLKWPNYRLRAISQFINRLKAPKRGRRVEIPAPELSTLTKVKNGKRAFEPGVIDDLIFYREWIKDNCPSN